MDHREGGAGDVSWGDLYRTLRRWKRFLRGALISVWGLAALAFFVTPRGVQCTATIAMPHVASATSLDLGPPDPLTGLRSASVDFAPPWSAEPGSEGLSMMVYKKLESALKDWAALEVRLSARMEPSRAAALARRLTNDIRPIIGGPAKQADRLEKGDVVIAVEVSHSAIGEGGAREVVTSLSDLVRSVLVAELTADYLAVQRAACWTVIARAKRLEAQSSRTNTSLDEVAQALERLPRALRDQPASREVVQVDNGGFRYLPVPLQLVGVRASQAAADHALRLAGYAVRLSELRLALLDRVEQRAASERQAARVPEPSSVIREEWARLKAEQPLGPEAEELEGEIETVTERAAGLRKEMRFLQAPTVEGQSRLPLLAALLLLTVLIFAIPLAVAFWQRVSAEAAEPGQR